MPHRAKPTLRAEILSRFTSVIEEGAAILSKATEVQAVYEYNHAMGRQREISPAFKKLDWQSYVEWRTRATTIATRALPRDHVHLKMVTECLSTLTPSEEHMIWAIGFLRGIKADFECGLLDDLAAQIGAELSCDLLGQAERLLETGTTGQNDHVAAAVIAGAVLEQNLRQLCQRASPSIPLLTPKGDPKTLNPLIEDLKRSGSFTELKAKQLRAWADVRNKAAHGEFADFTRSDVEQMTKGIANFLAEHVG